MNYNFNLEDYVLVILLVTYMCLYVKALKTVCTLCTRIFDSIINYFNNGKKQPYQKVECGSIFVKICDACAPPTIELIGILEKHNLLISINFGNHFCIWGFFIQIR